MSQISAAENITIELSPGRWQLQEADAQNPAVVATEEGMLYSRRFGIMRRLPDAGNLPSETVLQVVMGWQESDQAWHLGLVLAPELAQERGSRWCELAHWVDASRTMHKATVREAGMSLAEALGVPFNAIEPEDEPSIPAPPPPPLPDLPLKFGLWTMEMVALGEQERKGVKVHSRQVVITRSRRWAFNKTMRGLWYLFWSVVYAVISVATLTSDLALPNAGTLLPNPQLLPYLGLVTAVFLLLAALYMWLETILRYNIIILDPDEKSIQARKGQRVHWHYTGDAVQSVYVSEVFKRRSKDPNTDHGEINLHLGDKQFQFVFQQGEAVSNDEIDSDDVQKRTSDEILPMRRGLTTTALQGAALHIADILGDVPIWHDVRAK